MDHIPRRTGVKFSVRAVSYLILFAVLMTLIVCALSAVLIRSVDSVLLYFGQEDFAEIFAQLEDADLAPHFIIPFVLAVLFWLLVSLMRRKIGAWTAIPAAVLGIVLFAVSLAVSVWFADVNGIRLGTVALSLFDLIQAGAF